MFPPAASFVSEYSKNITNPELFPEALWLFIVTFVALAGSSVCHFIVMCLSLHLKDVNKVPFKNCVLTLRISMVP